MRYRPFGGPDYRSPWWLRLLADGRDRYGAIEDDEAVKAIPSRLDRGVNCVDYRAATARATRRKSWPRALEGHRRDVILVTKCGVKVPPAGQARAASRRSRAKSCAKSTRA